MIRALLPHRDFTLRPSPSPESRGPVLDLGRALVDRLAADAALPLRTAFSSAQRELLFRAGADVLARARNRGGASRLRAQGALLQAACSDGSPVRLRLDDLELTRGSTERSKDVLKAAAEELPFEQELAALESAAGREGGAVIWLERDQQLPALARLARRWPADLPLGLDGPFAHVHREALARWECLHHAGFVSQPPPRFAVERLAEDGSVEHLPWRAAGTPFPEGAFAGEASVAELVDGALDGRRCRRAVVRVTQISATEVVSAEGTRHPRAAVEAAVAALAAQHVPVGAEWWVGAPESVLEEIEQTAQALEARAPFADCVGVRAFHWTRGRPQGTFAGAPVRFKPRDPERDLWRSEPFEVSEELPAKDLPPLLESLAQRLSKRLRLAPGRLAGAYAAEPARVAQGGGALALDPEAAVVELPTSLDGVARTSFYAVSLRRGTTLAVDGRVAPLLRALSTPTPRDAALGTLPEPARGKLVAALLDKQLLAEVP